MKKKIWYITKYAVAPKYAKDLGSRQTIYAKYFAKKGFDVHFIHSYSTYKSSIPKFNSLVYNEKIDNVNYHILKGPKIDLGFNLKRIFSWIYFEWNLFRFIKKTKEKPNIVIISSLSLLTVLNGLYLKRKFKVKFIFEVRDIWPLTLLNIGNFSKKNIFVKLLSLIEKKGYNEADAIIGTMPNLKEHIKNTINKDFKFGYMPMGIDLEFLINEEKEWALPKDKFILGYAGAIGIVNQVNDILEAANLLRSNNDILFAILGDGSQKQILMDKYKDLENVTWLPKVEKKYVNSFLKRCNVLLHPCKNEKIYDYGVSPNKWIDYMYSAKPIIVSYNGYKNIINEANCGEFIEAENYVILSNKIIEYSKKEESELTKLGQNGYNYLIKNLNYDILSTKYLNFINEI